MNYVYIAYALDDGDAVGPLAAMLRGAGWGVRFGPVVEPGVNHRERIEAEIRDASAVLAIWSSNSVASPRVQSDVAFARQWGNLIAIRIDAASILLEGGGLVDLSDGQNLSSGPGAQAILEAIAMMPGLPSKSPDPHFIPELAPGGEMLPPRRGWKGLITVSALAVAGLAALGTAMFVSQAMRTSEAEPLDLAGAERVETPVGAETDSEHARALEDWGSVAKDDPLALRAFLASHGGAPIGEQARGALSRLERAAWSEVSARMDSAGILVALDAYRAEFPDGLFADEASGIERRERERIAEAQELLKAAGIGQAEPDGVLKPDTLAAIRAFQSSLGLEPTGLIDVGLMQALRSSSVSDARPGPAANGHATVAPAAAGVPPAQPAVVLKPEGPVRDCYVCPELIPLPPGRFVMGDVTGAAPADERPAREVRIDYRLAIGRYEVTFEEWDACVSEGGCRHRPDDDGLGRGNRPVVDVSPADVGEYLGWLGRKTGKRYRLPSEAEWEYAARAGAASAWYSGNDPAGLCAYANGADASSAYAWRNTACSDRFARGAAPVGSFRPNAFGLHDMMGNVWEWTADCWHSTYAAAPSDSSAWTRDCNTTDMVLRGGAYSVEVDKLRSSYRYHFAPKRMPFFGFRVVRVFD